MMPGRATSEAMPQVEQVPQVLLVNHWHDDNTGDSAITTVTMALLRRHWPACAITLVSMLGSSDAMFARAFRHTGRTQPDVVTRPSLVDALPSTGRLRVTRLARWALGVAGAGVATALGRPPSRLTEAIDASDLVVLVGGSNLFDTGRRPPLGTIRLMQCVLPVLVARRRGTPYALVGHTLGPVDTRLGRRLLRSVLRGASLVIVREPRSIAFVESDLGLSNELGDRLRCAPDVAFALDPLASARVGDVLRPLGGLRFGVLVPRSYHHPDPSRDAHLTTELVRFGRAALDAGLVDRIMVFAQCIGPTMIEDDRIIAARIAAGDERFVLVDDDLGPAEAAELYRHAELVVAVRLHAIILALSVGVPVHGIEYFTAKTSGVFAALGLDRHWSPFDGFDADVALGAHR